MKNKSFWILCFLLFVISVSAQKKESEKFWERLSSLCGKSFEGVIKSGGNPQDGFSGKRLVMQVLSCEENQIKIPFYVGEDKSRTWIISKEEEGLLSLRHEHRKSDGGDDELTNYGGKSTNHGLAHLQVFPANTLTTSMLPPAATNVWFLGLDENSFSYSLQRMGQNRVFTVVFDLLSPIEFNDRPWGSTNNSK